MGSSLWACYVLELDGRMPRDANQDDTSDSRSEAAKGLRLERFISELTQNQTKLRAYIVASIGSLHDASDILQKVNLKLWKSADEFRDGAEFMPWAVAFTRYEILSYCRDRRRDRHLFADDVVSLMLETVQEEVPDPDDRLLRLRHCIKKLPQKSREMLHLRYEEGLTLVQMSKRLQRSDGALKVAFVRVRKSLEACIERRLGAE